MSKIPEKLNLPQEYNSARIESILNGMAVQINAISENRITGKYNAYTAAPTTGTYAIGDFIPNTAPAELGVAAAKYVIIGWICTVSGTPGTWLQCRTLTGN